LVEKEENGYPIPGHNKTMIKVANDARDTQKKIHQKGTNGRNH
jgi:hypothetical protein